MAEFPTPNEGILLTHFIVSQDVERSRRFYTDVLGGETVLEGEPTIVALANGWVIINVGGGPTDDKPTVILETPPDPNRTSSFLNIRVADIQAVYADWSARGARFLTPPQDRANESRCYLRDPHGHRSAVGQSPRQPRGPDPGYGRVRMAECRGACSCRGKCIAEPSPAWPWAALALPNA